MARPQSVEDKDLIARLGCVFRDVGYAGATLSMLSEASGLKKASLYHRFPGGKQQMAEEVLAAALEWFGANVLEVLTGPGAPLDRVRTAAQHLDSFYAGGAQACLLNMLTSPRAEDGPFSAAIQGSMEALIDAFAALGRDAGCDPETASSRAMRAVTLLQGSLVVSRGLGSPEPFRAFIAGLSDEFIIAAAEPVRAANREIKPHDR